MTSNEAFGDLVNRCKASGMDEEEARDFAAEIIEAAARAAIVETLTMAGLGV